MIAVADDRRPEADRRADLQLDQPSGTRSFAQFLSFNPDAIGFYAEKIARFLGTGRYLAIQTIIVIIWIAINVAWVSLRFDPYPFILLNLAFSTQAAYAAPLILLAQNRQADRDKVQIEEDRARAAQTRADTEYLARELASLRVAIGELATRDFISRELDRLAPPDDEAAARRRKERKRKREQQTREARGARVNRDKGAD